MLSRGHVLALTLITLVFYVPFIGKGVSYDDLVFLDYAKRLTKNPTVCVVDDYLFLGHEMKDLIVFESTHPPLVPYVHKTVMWVFGENLVVMHLAMYGFLWLATVALAALIGRYTQASPLLALGITLGPIFLPNATSLMTDTALFACWFAAMVCWEQAMDGPDRLRTPWTLATAAFTCGAVFTAYQGLGLIVLLPLMGLGRGRLRQALLVTALGLAPFLLWMLLVWRNYGIVPYFSPPRTEVTIAAEVAKGLQWDNITLKSRALIYYLGAALWCFLPVLRPPRRALFAYAAAAGWGLAMTAYLFPERGWGLTLYAAAMAAAGIGALAAGVPAIAAALRNTDRARFVPLTLLTCMGGFLVFQLFLASFAAPRYNLVTLGALLVLILHLRPPRGALTTVLCLVPTLLLGLTVAYAEKEYADAQRIDRLPLPEGNVYFAGEKGVQYNGERAGYRYFLPKKSDDVHYLLVPDEIDHVAVPQVLIDYAENLDVFTIEGTVPVRVMQRAGGAGFYIHNRGMLPFIFSNEPIDRMRLYKVFHPGHTWWRERDYIAAPAGEILPDAPVYQDFTCGPDGLTTFRLMFATYNRRNASTLVVSLYPLDADGQEGPPAFEETLSATVLADNAWHRFDFPALRSKGRRYRLKLHTPDAVPATAVTVWTNTNAEGSFFRGSQEKPGALGLETLCAPGAGTAAH